MGASMGKPMNTRISGSAGLRGTRPIVRILAAFPVACFTCALGTDIAYAQTANMMWADFSDWLLAAGMAGAVLAGLAGLVSWLTGRRNQAAGRSWMTALAAAVTLVIALLNNLVHSRDAWTSVVPTGIGLSILTVIAMLITAWLASRTNPRLTLSQSGVRQ
jgi:uncharacterized membrane protein